MPFEVESCHVGRRDAHASCVLMPVESGLHAQAAAGPGRADVQALQAYAAAPQSLKKLAAGYVIEAKI